MYSMSRYYSEEELGAYNSKESEGSRSRKSQRSSSAGSSGTISLTISTLTLLDFSTDGCFHRCLNFLFIAIPIITSFSLGIYIGLRCKNEDYLWEQSRLALKEIYHVYQDYQDVNFENFLKQIDNNMTEDEIIDYVYTTWVEQGLTHIRVSYYPTFFSVTDIDHQNTVKVIGDSGQPLFTARNYEQLTLTKPKRFAHNHYSPKGIVTGDPIFVNFGTNADYEYLESLGIDLTNKIVIAKIGKIGAQTLMKNAVKRGAIGLVTFLDISKFERSDYSFDDFSLLRDALHRLAYDYSIKNIVSQPINFHDANIILEHLKPEHATPDNWKGGTAAEFLGPGLKEGQLEIVISSEIQPKIGKNICGSLRGRIIIDRYIIVAGTWNAFKNGTVTLSSKIAQLLETTRIMSRIHQSSKPIRNIRFCLWQETEYRTSGVRHWLEDNFDYLPRIDAFVNIDVCVVGKSFHSYISPFLYTALHDIADVVNLAIKEFDYKFESHLDQIKKGDFFRKASDRYLIHVFEKFPFVNFRWGSVEDELLYCHTSLFDTYHNLEHIDPEFLYHKVCINLKIDFIHSLANDALTLTNTKHATMVLKYAFEKVIQRGQSLPSVQDLFEKIHLGIDRLLNQSNDWEHYWDSFSQMNRSLILRYNRRIRQFQRSFTTEDYSFKRDFCALNLFIGADPDDKYRIHYFPGIKYYLRRQNASDVTYELRLHLRQILSGLDMATSALEF